MTHHISDGTIGASITDQGAELVSLRRADGPELLWQAGPVWPRHAPVLFPIVGRLAGDTLRHEGQAYRLTQHGFARDRGFAWVARDPTSCRLALEDDEATRACYPFGFRLELAYEVADGALTQSFHVTNTGSASLPVSFGAHPALRWPLADGIAKEVHTLTFSDPEPSPVRRLEDGLILPQPAPSPIEGRTLRLRPELFADDAIILDHPASSSVTYGAPGARRVTVAWRGMTQLGIWSKPQASGPADFVCIEPWSGFASPVGFDGAFADKPGLRHIAPGRTESASLTITISSNTD